MELEKHVQETQQRVHDALLDNLNTQAALAAVCDLIKETNKYLSACETDASGTKPGPWIRGSFC